MRRLATVFAALVLVSCGSSGDAPVAEETTTTRLTLLPTTTTSTLPVPTTTEAPAFSATAGTTTSTGAPAPDTSVATSIDPDLVPASTGVPTSTIGQTDAPQPPDREVDPTVTALELSSRGIGGAAFGAEPEGVIAYLSSFLGEPTTDTGWIDPFAVGNCPGTELRQVGWSTLVLTFGDVSEEIEGRRHFFAYRYGLEDQPPTLPAGLATSSGVSLGDTLPAAIAAEPSAELLPGDGFTPPTLVVNERLVAYLSGLADASTITVILGGRGCE